MTKTFEFMYGNSWYRFEGDRITKQFGSTEYYDYFCPVAADLCEKIDSFSTDQLKSIMEAILHGYFYGVGDGKKEKIREFKRVFALD